MKRIIATTLTALMLAGVAAGGSLQTASAAPFHPLIHAIVSMSTHHKHWHEHQVCKRTWHHHHKVTVCYWVPNHY